MWGGKAEHCCHALKDKQRDTLTCRITGVYAVLSSVAIVRGIPGAQRPNHTASVQQLGGRIWEAGTAIHLQALNAGDNRTTQFGALIHNAVDPFQASKRFGPSTSRGFVEQPCCLGSIKRNRQLATPHPQPVFVPSFPIEMRRLRHVVALAQCLQARCKATVLSSPQVPRVVEHQPAYSGHR